MLKFDYNLLYCNLREYTKLCNHMMYDHVFYTGYVKGSQVSNCLWPQTPNRKGPKSPRT